MGYVFERGGRVREDTARRTLWQLFNNGCLPNKIAGLPSWCADLQVQRGPSTPSNLPQMAKRGFAAGYEGDHMGFTSYGYLYTANTGVIDIRRGVSQNVIVVKGTVFDHLREVYTPYPEVCLRPDMNPTGYFNLQATVGGWEREVSDKVLGCREIEAGGEGIVSLDTYWRTLVGNRTNLSEGDPEFTCETLYALRDFRNRLSKTKTKFEQLEKR